MDTTENCPTLTSKRLVLRRFRHEDWRDLFEYLSQEEAVRFEPYGPKTQRECMQEAIRRSQTDAFWAVCLKDGQKLIGNLYLAQLQPEKYRTWEIGYVFNPLYWGKGYATESCKCLFDYAFNVLKAHRIVAFCNPENTASWRLMERLRMRRECHMVRNAFFRCDDKGNPVWADAYGYALLSEEWRGALPKYI